MITTGELLGRVMAAAGIDEIYDVGDTGIGRLLAAAHRRVHFRRAAVRTPDATYEIDGGGSVVDLAAAAEAPGVILSGPVTVRVGDDLAAPAADVSVLPVEVERWRAPDDDVVGRIRNASHVVVLAGPEVVATRAVADLRAFAATAHVGVLNTWGAKGVFDWRSRHHLATAGLQDLDFELGGLKDRDLIIATGVDPAESPPQRWRLSPSVDVHPLTLGPLAEVCGRAPAPIDIPPLRAGLAAVTQEGWAATGTPVAPPQVTRNYAAALGTGGLVAADPGGAGYWVARTFGTVETGSVIVPARGAPDGLAIACAIVARLRRPRMRVLAVVDGPVSAQNEAVLEAGERLGVRVPVEVWSPFGAALDPTRHCERLARLVTTERPGRAELAVDDRWVDRMIDVAGPIVAWEAR